jgi:hypothetical protein
MNTVSEIHCRLLLRKLKGEKKDKVFTAGWAW